MCVVGPHRERFGLQHGPYSALAGPSTDLGLRGPGAAAAAKESPIVPSSMPVAALKGWRGPLRLANARFTYSLKVDLMLFESV
jgi:hypothetical protein